MRAIIVLLSVAAASLLAASPASAHWRYGYGAWGYPVYGTYAPAWTYDIYGGRGYATDARVFVYSVPGNGYVDETCRVVTEPGPMGWRRLRVCE